MAHLSDARLAEFVASDEPRLEYEFMHPETTVARELVAIRTKATAAGLGVEFRELAPEVFGMSIILVTLTRVQQASFIG